MQSLIIAFAMYSKIPMPRADWNDKNMRYAFCWFPVIGLVIGVIGAYIFCAVGGFDPVFTPSSIFLTVLFSAGVGIVFGVYPAKKAAEMSPIEALRHD